MVGGAQCVYGRGAPGGASALTAAGLSCAMSYALQQGRLVMLVEAAGGLQPRSNPTAGFDLTSSRSARRSPLGSARTSHRGWRRTP